MKKSRPKKNGPKKELDLLFDSDVENGISWGSDEDISEFSSDIGAVMELIADKKLKIDGIEAIKLNLPASEAEKVTSFYMGIDHMKNGEAEAFAWTGHKNVSFITVLTDRSDKLIAGLFKNQKNPVVAKYLNSVMPAILSDRI